MINAEPDDGRKEIEMIIKGIVELLTAYKKYLRKANVRLIHAIRIAKEGDKEVANALYTEAVKLMGKAELIDDMYTDEYGHSIEDDYPLYEVRNDEIYEHQTEYLEIVYTKGKLQYRKAIEE